MSNIDLSKSMKITWEPKKCQGASSIRLGDYHIDKLGFKHPDFLYKLSRKAESVGFFKTVDEAKAACREHKEQIK